MGVFDLGNFELLKEEIEIRLQFLEIQYFFYRPARSTDVNKVLIRNDPSDNGCWSYVGNQQKGTQIIEISEWGFNNRTVPHELLHGMGIYHEQSRPDRDNYVEIHDKCIQSGRENNLDKQTTSKTYGIEYNPKSIMHYSSTAFSKHSGCKTITSRVNFVY